MNRDELRKISENKIRAILQNHIPAKAQVFLFGSRARKDSRWNSDYDLWIDAELAPTVLDQIEEELEESIVPFKVDLVTTRQLTGRFGEQVRREATPWM